MPRPRRRLASWSAWLLAAALAVVIPLSSWWGYESDDHGGLMFTAHEGVLDLRFFTARDPRVVLKSSGLWPHGELNIFWYAQRPRPASYGEPLQVAWSAPLGLLWLGKVAISSHTAILLRLVLWPFIPLLAALGWFIHRRSPRSTELPSFRAEGRKPQASPRPNGAPFPANNHPCPAASRSPSASS